MTPRPILNALARRWGRWGRARLSALALGVLLGLAGWGGAHAAPEPAQPACPPQPEALTPQQVQAGLREARDHGLLWRVEAGGRTSWLYGTVHAARLAWMFPGPQVRQALLASDRVMLELDLLDEHIQQQMRQTLLAPAADGLAGLAPALRQRLAAQLRALCADASVERLHPELQLATLAMLALRADGLEAAYGIDGFLAGLARGLGKPVESLETPALQMAALLSSDAREREQLVASTLEELESGRLRSQGLRLIEAWAGGDLDTLERYPQWCDCLDTPAEREASRRLLEDRHPQMVERIERLHRQGQSLFVAVGSLHLTGPQGLPALLAQRGMRVTRVLPGLPGDAQSAAQSDTTPVPSPPAQGDK